MNLEKLLELVFENPDNISIEYSNINGKEKFIVNGKELSIFDDSEIKTLISEYKKNIELLDDCTFTEAMEALEDRSENIDLNQLDKLINQESFTEKEAQTIKAHIDFMSSIIHEKISNKIQILTELLDKF